MTGSRAGNTALCLATIGLLSSCRDTPPDSPDQSPTAHVSVQADSATLARLANLTPGAVATVTADTATIWTGPGGRSFEVARRSAAPPGGPTRLFGTITRPIALRTRPADLSQYPCASCHQGRTIVMKDQRITDAHQNIQPVHPSQTRAICSTCHAANNVDQLTLRGGGRAPLDASYRLCGQCHFAEAEAWAGGGHGKRLDGWAGRRVVMACTDCHDPHAPAIQPRVPFRAPEIARIRRDP